MKLVKSVALLIVSTFVFLACVPAEVGVPPVTAEQDNKNQEEMIDYFTKNSLNKNVLSIKATDGTTNSYNAYYAIINNGTGAIPRIGEEVRIQYKRYVLSTGDKLDSSLVSPIDSVVSTSVVIGGTNLNPANAVAEILSKCHVGDSTIILLPAGLAFGGQASSKVPAFSTLRYSIKILSSNTEAQQLATYINAAQKIWKTLPNAAPLVTSSGLNYIRQITGTDTTTILSKGQTVRVSYIGKLLDGRQVCSGDSLTFVLGNTNTQNAVIKGIDEGVQLMKKGESATIIFPSSLGYGSTSNGEVAAPYAPSSFGYLRDKNNAIVPGYTPLVFKITVLTVK